MLLLLFMETLHASARPQTSNPKPSHSHLLQSLSSPIFKLLKKNNALLHSPTSSEMIQDPGQGIRGRARLPSCDATALGASKRVAMCWKLKGCFFETAAMH